MRARSLLRVGRQGFLLGRRVLIAPWRWSTPSGRSIVLLLGSDKGNQLLCSLAMFLELLPGLALDNPHLDEDWSEKVVATCFDQRLRCHATLAPHGEFAESLNEVFDQLSFLLLGEEESVHVDVGLFLKEAAKELGFQIVPTCNRAFRQLVEPFEGHPLESAEE